MRVAVVGAGLAGLAAAWNLTCKGAKVVLFDPKGIGGGASGVSTGLLHPFPGKRATKSWRADEGMEATKELLLIAEQALGRPVASYSGVFRPAITDAQKIDFQANQNPDAIWTHMHLPELTPGLWIEKGITVFSCSYLEGLWKACEKKGSILVRERFLSKEGFDAVVLATGAETKNFEACKHFSFRTAIGQSLLCRWKNPLPFSLASQGYITVTEDPALCQVGSTYEHTKEPDPKKALELIDKVALFYPPAKEFEVLEIRSGTRISPKEGHQPIAERLQENIWVFTGLGSRGMLYHALIAKELVSSILLKRDG